MNNNRKYFQNIIFNTFKFFQRNIFHISFFFFLINTVFFISSCEDDPLLEPTTETEDKGSYAKLSLPSSKKELDKKNPEIY